MGKPIKYTLEHFGDLAVESSSDLQVFKIEENLYKVIKEGVSYTLRIINFNEEDKTFEIAVNGIKISGKGESKLDAMIAKLGFNENSAASVKEILAPMPGLVLDIKPAVGDLVEEGDPLLVLEAMKMENIIKSPGQGVIKMIHVTSSDAVDKGQVLLEFE